MLDWLLNTASALSGLAAAIWQAILFLFNLIIALAQFLLRLILAVLNYLADLLKKVAGFFRMLWNSFFKRIFADFFNVVRRLHGWLEQHLGPIIRYIQKMRAYMDRLFRLYVKPFLNMIQRVRQFLQVLRLLHVKWAAALDAKLAKVEADVASLFLAVRGILTGAIDILNCLADPLNLFRRPTAVLSIRRIIPSLVRVLTGLPPGYFMPSYRPGARPGLGPLPFDFTPGDPVYNPPASSYFATNDGLGLFEGFANGEVPDDGAVDDLEILDIFDDGLWPDTGCSDAASCLQAATNFALNTQFLQTQGA
jgi:hypothetical protein